MTQHRERCFLGVWNLRITFLWHLFAHEALSKLFLLWLMFEYHQLVVKNFKIQWQCYLSKYSSSRAFVPDINQCGVASDVTLLTSWYPKSFFFISYISNLVLKYNCHKMIYNSFMLICYSLTNPYLLKMASMNAE